MAQAIRIYEAGSPDVLQFEQVADPVPEAGEAVVRHQAIGVNFIDTYHRSGLYPLAHPHGLGIEASGVVEEVGAGVTNIKPGDRVAYAHPPTGAYSDRRTHNADYLVPVPDGVADDVAAAVLLKAMTVDFLVRRTFRVEPGMTVLLHAAAGGVGLMACQWLAHIGATVIGTVSSTEKAELARNNGCTHTVIHSEEDFVERVKELTDGEGVPVVYDSIGKDTLTRSLDCLRPLGLMVSFGNASGKPDPVDLGLLADRGSLRITRPRLFDFVSNRADLLQSASTVFDLVGRGVINAEIGQRFALADAAEAHRALEARRTTGSTVLVP